MNIEFSPKAWDEYLEWSVYDKKLMLKVNEIIKDITRSNPFKGLGKPEPLKYDLQGYWSRRITDEHRMVYKVEGDKLFISQLQHHYENN